MSRRGSIQRKQCSVYIIRGRLFANMVEMASKAARKLADNLDEKNVLSSDCFIFFARLERTRYRCMRKGAASVGTEGFPG